jgi:uncharacterized protein YbaA (DUF1428 family)
MDRGNHPLTHTLGVPYGINTRYHRFANSATGVLTTHGTALYVDAISGELRHGPFTGEARTLYS